MKICHSWYLGYNYVHVINPYFRKILKILKVGKFWVGFTNLKNSARKLRFPKEYKFGPP